jgi:predicted dehydrogenase
MDYQLMGTKGGCRYGEGEVYTDQNGHMVTIKPDFFNPVGSGGFDGPNSFFTSKLRDFTNHILNGTPTIIAAENGLMVQQMLSAIYESADKGGREVLIK